MTEKEKMIEDLGALVESRPTIVDDLLVVALALLEKSSVKE